MRELLQDAIRRARSAGPRPNATVPTGSAELEALAADAVRLARVATAVHLAEAVRTGAVHRPDECARHARRRAVAGEVRR